MLLVGAVLTAGLSLRVVLRGLEHARADSGVFAWPVRIDLNHAPIAELMSLPGIGRTRAAAIVLHRVRHGPFAAAEDLGAVDGIGPDTVARLRPFVNAGPQRR